MAASADCWRTSFVISRRLSAIVGASRRGRLRGQLWRTRLFPATCGLFPLGPAQRLGLGAVAALVRVLRLVPELGELADDAEHLLRQPAGVVLQAVLLDEHVHVLGDLGMATR